MKEKKSDFDKIFMAFWISCVICILASFLLESLDVRFDSGWQILGSILFGASVAAFSYWLVEMLDL